MEGNSRRAGMPVNGLAKQLFRVHRKERRSTTFCRHPETMDYNGIATLVWFTLLGLAILTLVVGFSVRAFLAPVIREALGHLRSEADREQQLLGVRMERVEECLSRLETGLARLDAAGDLHRRLGAPREDEAPSRSDDGADGGG